MAQVRCPLCFTAYLRQWGRSAWNFAYQNGYAEKMEAAFKIFRDAGGVVFLVDGHTNEAKREMTKIKEAVKRTTSNETE